MGAPGGGLLPTLSLLAYPHLPAGGTQGLCPPWPSPPSREAMNTVSHRDEPSSDWARAGEGRGETVSTSGRAAVCVPVFLREGQRGGGPLGGWARCLPPCLSTARRQEITQALIRSPRDRRKLECPQCLIVPAPAAAAGTLEASVMAAFSSPRSPAVTLGGLEPDAVLMKNQELGDRCGSEGAGWGRARCAVHLSTLAAGRPAPTTSQPNVAPRGAAWGPPKGQRRPLPGTLGPADDEELVGGHWGASV